MGKAIQVQEIIAISNNGEILQSAITEVRGKAIYVRETGSSAGDRVARMANHIENLAATANTAHMKLRGTTEDVLVTRLTMNEFSLYTKDSPLSLDEYKLLIKKIDGITSTLSPNIHLLLATIPVHWPDNSVHNCALYVQSAISDDTRPLIHHFAKKNDSSVDFHYVDKTGHPLPLRGDTYGTDDSPVIVLSDTEVRTQDVHQFESALKIVTAEGESFITLIDICLDHRVRVAERNLAGLVAQLKSWGLKVPLYMSQVITSHTIAPIKKNIFTSLTQADKDFKAVDRLPPNETIRLPSSFGGFVDLTIFPPTYLEIPYRKRVLRQLSTAVPGQTILEETVTQPRTALYLEKRIKSLAGLGVTMSPEIQQQYQTWLDNFIFSMGDLLEQSALVGDSTISATESSTTPELGAAEHWVELLLTEFRDESAIARDFTVASATESSTSDSSSDLSETERWVDSLLAESSITRDLTVSTTDASTSESGIQDPSSDLSETERWVDSLLAESAIARHVTVPSTTDASLSESGIHDPSLDFSETERGVDSLLADMHVSQEQEKKPIVEGSEQPLNNPETPNAKTTPVDWLDSINNQEEAEESPPWPSASSAGSSLYCESNPYSLFFSGAKKEVEEIKRPFKNHSATYAAHSRFMAGGKVARGDEVEKRRRCCNI